jgi:hypothetical protein
VRNIAPRSGVADDRDGRPHSERSSGMATMGVRERDMSGGGYGGSNGAGWVLFAGIMIVMLGILNVIYGIAAIGDSKFFVADQKYILSGLHTWGWVTLILGALQIAAAFSIWNGGTFGRWFGITVAVFSAIAALLSMPAYPFWSLSVFALDVLVIYGLAAYGGDSQLAARDQLSR